MTGTWTDRRLPAWALWGVAFLGVVLRVSPFLAKAGPWGFAVDYDEGVYFSAAALLAKGILPYRDFVFVHPPGLLFALSPLGALASLVDPSVAFMVARLAMVGVGAINVVLVGRLGDRACGPWAGLFAALLYAAHPEAVAVERGPFLEPVLNLLCLAFALVWLAPKGQDRRRLVRTAVSGAVLGGACLVKLWGVLWLAAALVSLPPKEWRRGVLLVTAALALALVGLAPFLHSAALKLWTDVVWFHSVRPPDGTLDLLVRAKKLAMEGFGLFPLLAVLGAILATKKKEPAARFVATGYVLVLAAFFAAPSYWTQYNAHLAPLACVLAGAALSALVNEGRRRSAGVAGAACLLLLAGQAAVRSRRTRAQNAVGAAIRLHVPPQACLFSFAPAWGLVGGRLPPLEMVPRVVDSYAQGLLDAALSGRKFSTASDAFADEATQTSYRALLESCEFVVLGIEGHSKLSLRSQAVLQANFTRLHPPSGAGGIDLWQRRPRPATP